MTAYAFGLRQAACAEHDNVSSLCIDVEAYRQV